MDDMSNRMQAQEIRKSNVRVGVTYTMTVAYAIAGLGLDHMAHVGGQDRTRDRRVFGARVHESDDRRVLVGSRGSARGSSGSGTPEEGTV